MVLYIFILLYVVMHIDQPTLSCIDPLYARGGLGKIAKIIDWKRQY